MRSKILIIPLILLIFVSCVYSLGIERRTNHSNKRPWIENSVLAQVVGGSVGIQKITLNDSNEDLSPEIKEYKRDFNISHPVRVEIGRKLIERKREDRENYFSIVKISNLIESQDRDLMSDELLKMDRKFIKKLERNMNDERIKRRILEYEMEVKFRKKFKLTINETRINDVFNGKITLDQFSEELLRNIN